MATRSRNHGWVMGVAFAFSLLSPSAAHAQNTLERARSLYEAADYDGALQILAVLRTQNTSSEVAAYQVFCLFALGRNDEAKKAVQNIVQHDPLYRPQNNQVSPRIRAFFDEVRKPLLAEIARQTYATAKTAYEKKDWVGARDGFGRVVALLDELSVDEGGQSDMRTVAAGFRDLAINSIATAEAAAAAAEAAKPSPTPIATPTPTPIASPTPSATPEPPPAPVPPIFSEGDPGVAKPIAINRALPQWRPNAVELKQTFSGMLELTIDEAGKVSAVRLIKSVNPRYDPTLLTAAKAWTFQPAKKDGQPVKYRFLMSVNLEPPK